MTSTPIYRAIMIELEDRRRARGISMDMMTELSGAAERSFSKALHPDTPSGRQANWDKLQQFVDVLYPDGFEVVIRPGTTAVATTNGTKALIRHTAAHFDGRTRRELMRDLSKIGAALGGKARLKLPRWKRRALARRAAREKWLRHRAKSIETAFCSPASEQNGKTSIGERET